MMLAWKEKDDPQELQQLKRKDKEEEDSSSTVQAAVVRLRDLHLEGADDSEVEGEQEETDCKHDKVEVTHSTAAVHTRGRPGQKSEGVGPSPDAEKTPLVRAAAAAETSTPSESTIPAGSSPAVFFTPVATLTEESTKPGSASSNSGNSNSSSLVVNIVPLSTPLPQAQQHEYSSTAATMSTSSNSLATTPQQHYQRHQRHQQHQQDLSHNGTTTTAPTKTTTAINTSPPKHPPLQEQQQQQSLVSALTSILKTHGELGEGLPDSLLTSHCTGLVKVLRETASLQRFILGESQMHGDSQAYMDVCAHHDAKRTQKQMASLRLLRDDFNEKHAALLKEFRGLREQVTTMRCRVQNAAWPAEKKTLILAALQRYDTLYEQGGELKTLDLTESAIGAVQKLRRQLPRLPEDADVLKDILGRIKRVSRTLMALGLTTEAHMTAAWESVLELLTYRPMSFVVEETEKAWRELRDVKLQEAQRRQEQKSRLRALVDRLGSPGSSEEKEEQDEEREEEGEEEEGIDEEEGVKMALKMPKKRREEGRGILSGMVGAVREWGEGEEAREEKKGVGGMTKRDKDEEQEEGGKEEDSEEEGGEDRRQSGDSTLSFTCCLDEDDEEKGEGSECHLFREQGDALYAGRLSNGSNSKKGSSSSSRRSSSSSMGSIYSRRSSSSSIVSIEKEKEVEGGLEGENGNRRPFPITSPVAPLHQQLQSRARSSSTSSSSSPVPLTEVSARSTSSRSRDASTSSAGSSTSYSTSCSTAKTRGSTRNEGEEGEDENRRRRLYGAKTQLHPSTSSSATAKTKAISKSTKGKGSSSTTSTSRRGVPTASSSFSSSSLFSSSTLPTERASMYVSRTSAAATSCTWGSSVGAGGEGKGGGGGLGSVGGTVAMSGMSKRTTRTDSAAAPGGGNESGGKNKAKTDTQRGAKGRVEAAQALTTSSSSSSSNNKASPPGVGNEVRVQGQGEGAGAKRSQSFYHPRTYPDSKW
ncbi:hypothetical protein VYU27_006361 [Nannochloropsis oceanica]